MKTMKAMVFHGPSAKGGGYLFNHKALAKVFRAKFLTAVGALGLPLPPDLPEDWVVDCKCVGTGGPALVYLGRYLYRGKRAANPH